MRTPRSWAECKSCAAKITWVRTPAGKAMPIDGHTYASKWSKSMGSHWETCPKAQQHSKQAMKPSVFKPGKRKGESK